MPNAKPLRSRDPRLADPLLQLTSSHPAVWLAVASMALLGVACSSGSGVSDDPSGTPDAGSTSFADGGLVGASDVSLSEDDAGADESDVNGGGGKPDRGTDPSDATGGAGTADSSNGGQCGLSGDPCEEPIDCCSGYCVLGPDGHECTKTCDQDCEPGSSCKQINTGGDPAFICVPDHVLYCAPCVADADCTEGLEDVAGHRCLEHPGGAGSFCATTCAEDSDCPGGASCNAVDVDGEVLTLCQPDDGLCECTAAAVSFGATTSCWIGNDEGQCSGTRACLSSGLSACDAPTATAEVCNELDDDCDGAVDEAFPDLGLPCDGEDADACEGGVWICTEGAIVCDDVAELGIEVCNDLDDDCDGETDEHLPEKGQACDGKDADECSDGVLICGMGDTLACDDDEAGIAEVCNDLDDDCDGTADEDFKEKGIPCDGDDEDTCEDGKLVCGPDGTALVCDDELGTSADVCNGVDDDCDGETDEDYPTLGDACDGDDVDLCADGFIVCDEDGGAVCGDDAVSVADVCNGVDDDCDGFTDEDHPLKGTPCDGPDADQCPDGTWHCDEQGGLTCDDDETSHEDICNDLDDDCDGGTDEDYGLKGASCDGADDDICEDGEWVCDGTGLTCDDDPTPAVEECNDLDDDCDGQTDEDFPDKGQACDGEDADECLTGTWGCNGVALVCDDDGASTDELCNDLDDDCDGETDEPFPDKGQACDGTDDDKCADGVWSCDGTALFCTDDGVSKVETCNDLDDDCDGDVDEGIALKGQPCDGDDDDDCSDGVYVCGGDGGVICNDDPSTSAEVCNDIDDDCDGTVDEGFPTKGTECDGTDSDQCAEGTWICNGTALVCSDDTGPNAELCNDLDDDCDGQTDEPFTDKGTSCDGADGDSCEEGLWQCNGSILICTDDTPTAQETCNDLDDDCDGQTDEGFPLKGQACDGDDGDLCAEGFWTCDGTSLLCSDSTGTASELCNNLDDDCDGGTDEGFALKGQPCDGGDVDNCADGQWVCDGTNLVCTDATSGNTEVCNNIDDDCDGQTDEGFALKGQPCDGTDGDNCNEGFWQCDGTGLACSDIGGTNQEVCNNIDDDCDGTVDEGFGLKGQTCDGNDADLCKEGSWVCDGTNLVCTDTGASNQEVCNNVDDDCDGTVDEGFPNKGQSCDGNDSDQCKEGVWVCNGSSLTCNDNTGNKVETCNNFDDDCDGSKDENLSRSCNLGCTNGTEVCSNGSWVNCNAAAPKSCYDYGSCTAGVSMCVSSCPSKPSEVCDLKDNDCDGSFDEGFYGDSSNSNSDFPDTWSTGIPQLASYPGTKSGSVAGKLLPESDHDWFSLYAVEDDSDFCITNDMDNDVQATITFNSPGSGLWYEVCACWSTATTFCGKNEGARKCATSVNGGTVTLDVDMKMTCGSSDSGWLDVEIAPDIPSLDKSCDNWTMSWSISG